MNKQNRPLDVIAADIKKALELNAAPFTLESAFAQFINSNRKIEIDADLLRELCSAIDPLYIRYQLLVPHHDDCCGCMVLVMENYQVYFQCNECGEKRYMDFTDGVVGFTFSKNPHAESKSENK